MHIYKGILADKLGKYPTNSAVYYSIDFVIACSSIIPARNIGIDLWRLITCSKHFSERTRRFFKCVENVDNVFNLLFSFSNKLSSVLGMLCKQLLGECNYEALAHTILHKVINIKYGEDALAKANVAQAKCPQKYAMQLLVSLLITSSIEKGCSHCMSATILSMYEKTFKLACDCGEPQLEKLIAAATDPMQLHSMYTRDGDRSVGFAMMILVRVYELRCASSSTSDGAVHVQFFASQQKERNAAVLLELTTNSQWIAQDDGKFARWLLLEHLEPALGREHVSAVIFNALIHNRTMKNIVLLSHLNESQCSVILAILLQEASASGEADEVLHRAITTLCALKAHSHAILQMRSCLADRSNVPLAQCMFDKLSRYMRPTAADESIASPHAGG